MFCSVLFRSVLHCTALLCSVLHCSVLFCSVHFGSVRIGSVPRNRTGPTGPTRRNRLEPNRTEQNRIVARSRKQVSKTRDGVRSTHNGEIVHEVSAVLHHTNTALVSWTVKERMIRLCCCDKNYELRHVSARAKMQPVYIRAVHTESIYMRTVNNSPLFTPKMRELYRS